MKRTRLIFAALAIVVASFAAMSGPAIADDECDFRERGDRDDVVVCNDDGDREVYDADDSLYYIPFLYVEEIDIDCDEIDDDSDGWVDEGAVCEVEFEFEEVFD